MAWKPITRVRGSSLPRPHPRDALLLQVTVKVSAYPPREWVEYFQHPGGMRVFGDTVFGESVTVDAQEAQIGHAISKIDNRIDRANRRYERDVLPLLRTREEKKKRAEAEKEERLAAARVNPEDL